jgi:hypothetical protein
MSRRAPQLVYRGPAPDDSDPTVAEMQAVIPEDAQGLPTFGSIFDNDRAGSGGESGAGSAARITTTGRFSNVVLKPDALERRRWLMMYRDTDVEMEFVTFSNRSPWPFPFVTLVCVLNSIMLYVGPLPHWGTLVASATWVLLLPFVVLLSTTLRRRLPERFAASDRSRALFIEHAVIPVFAVSVVFLILASVRCPLWLPFHVSTTFGDSFHIFHRDVDPVSGRAHVLDMMLDMQSIMFIPMCTTPRVTTAAVYLVASCAAGIVIISKFTVVRSDFGVNLFAAELVLKTIASLLLLGGWEWDRRCHFEICVQAFRQSRQMHLLVARLHQHIDAALPFGCAAPASTSIVDTRYSADDAAIVTLQIVLPPIVTVAMGNANAARVREECEWRLMVLRCLVDACDRQCPQVGASRVSAMGNEVIVTVGLFARTANTQPPSSRSVLHTSSVSPSVRACAFATGVMRAFRAEYRRRLPDDMDDAPALRIGLDVGCVEAVVPHGTLSVLVSGRAVRGAEVLASMAMPGSALLTGEVRAAVSGHFSTTELHRLRVAGRTTAVSMLGQQFSELHLTPDALRQSMSPEQSGASRSDPLPAIPRSRRQELKALLRVDPADAAAMESYACSSQRFADPDVERDYLMHETNTSLTRYVGPVLALLACVALIATYYAHGSGINVAEWCCLAASGGVSLAAVYVVHHGNMSQAVQIAVRMGMILLAFPLFLLSTMFHDPFFDFVRFRAPLIMAPAGIALTNIAPSKMPAVLDAVVRIVVHRMCLFVFIGFTPQRNSAFLACSEFVVALGTFLVIRSRNRSEYVDYAIADQQRFLWSRAHALVEEMLSQLLPVRVASRITASPTATAAQDMHFTNAIVVCITARLRTQTTAGSAAARHEMSRPSAGSSSSENCGPEEQRHSVSAMQYDLQVRSLLQAMPSIAAGTAHLRRHGTRWVIVANLDDTGVASETIDTETLQQEIDDVKRELAFTGGDALCFAAAIRAGVVVGGVLGERAARGFVAIGPALDAAVAAVAA